MLRFELDGNNVFESVEDRKDCWRQLFSLANHESVEDLGAQM